MNAANSLSSSPSRPTSPGAPLTTGPNPAALPPIQARRRWYRLHFLSCLLLVFCLLIATIVELPGNDTHELRIWRGDPSTGDLSDETDVIVQGWPLVYACRNPDRAPSRHTSNFAAIWNPFDSVVEFRGWALALDLSIVIV